MVSTEATPYLKKTDGTVTSGSLITSGGTAYPIKESDGFVYGGGDHASGYISGYKVDNSTGEPGIMLRFNLYKDFDGENTTYGGFVRSDTDTVMDDGITIEEDDDHYYKEAWTMYDMAKYVNFTVIE